MTSRFQNILITGASSGIGAALAMACAADGRMLVLTGRDHGRLEAVAEACRSKGARAEGVALDVGDRAGMAALLRRADAGAPLDLVVANAGIAAAREDPAFARALVETNILGMLNTLEPAAELMAARGRGQIAVMSSLAAFRAFGGPPGYAASKAWARLYGEALRGRLAGKGVGVSVVCPGFVATPMTAEIAAQGRAMMPANAAAAVILAGLERNAARISFPGPLAARVWLAAALPAWWSDRAIRRRWAAARKGG